jgi:polyhydroxyalkanoate synthesis regulator phasin
MSMAERPRQRAERIVADLAKRGETRAKGLQKAARGIADRSTRSRKEIVSLVQKEIRRQIRSLGLATRDEVDRLQRRIRDLEKGGSARKAKPKPKPKPKKPKSAGR